MVFLTWHNREENIPWDIPKVYSFAWGERMRWRVEMRWFEMDGGDQREPPLVFNFLACGKYGGLRCVYLKWMVRIKGALCLDFK